MIGDIKTGLELGKPFSRRYHKYIYHACIDCGLERWTGYDGGIVNALRCKACENRFKAKLNPHLYKKGIGNGLSYEEKPWLKDPKYLELQRINHLGKPSYWKGKKRPDMGEHLSKISKGQRRSPKTEFKKGQFAKEKHPNWKGGISPESKLERAKPAYAEWRLMVFGRDNFTCQECGRKGIYLHAHHIMEFAKHTKLRLDVENGITLCKDCHMKLHGLAKKGGDANAK